MATSDLNGSFAFRNLPRIDLLCRVSRSRDGQSPAIVPSAVFEQSDTVALDTGIRVLLDNFDDAYGPRTWFDLSAMSALSFAAKGTGTVRVLFLSKLIKDNYSGADHFEKTIELSDAWQQLRFTPAELAPPEESGYGMLITVYMDNATNNTRDKFDRLWKYYNSFLNSNGLMHWKIDGFGGIVGTNAATDAEMDVAAALVQANKQWGDQKYLDDARVLIDKIWKHEVNANGYLKPGDTWDSKKNPSYFSTAALESFKHTGSQDWTNTRL